VNINSIHLKKDIIIIILTTPMSSLSSTVVSVLLLLITPCHGFQPTTPFGDANHMSYFRTIPLRRDSSSPSLPLFASTLMDDFKTVDGEVIEPHRVLRVPWDANQTEVRGAYKKLSKKYHPDAVRSMKVLPGRCNNLDDVRDEWERVRFSYKILSDKKMRARYERHSTISDPGASLRRTAFNAAGRGLGMVVGGVLSLAFGSDKDDEGDNKEESEIIMDTDLNT